MPRLIGQKRQRWAKELGEGIAYNLFTDMFINPEYRGMLFTWDRWGKIIARTSRSQVYMAAKPTRDLKALQDIAETACKKKYKNLIKLFVNHKGNLSG